MGTWGTSIFADDTAADVRDDYRDMVASGVSDADALARMQKKYLDKSPDLRKHVEPLFWIALALTQWKLGRLDETTKTNATQIIDSGQDIQNWRQLGASEADLRKRVRVLAAARQQLCSPQGPQKSLRPQRKTVSPFRPGDVVRFTLSSGKMVLFRITSLYIDRGGEAPIAEVLDWIGTAIPSEAELKNLQSRHRSARIMLPPLPKDGFDPSRVKLVASGIPMPIVPVEHFTMWPWPYLESGLATSFGLQ